MVPETTQLIVRQTYLDRTREAPAELRIERIGGEKRPSPLTPELVDKGLASSAGLVVGCSNLFAGWAKGFQLHTNQLPRFDDSVSMGAGGDPNICYYHGYWQLGLEEALLIEVMPPECRSWNFQLDNHWMESLDYRYFRVTLNKHTAAYEPDGSVKILVAHEDPGHPNWIETTGARASGARNPSSTRIRSSPRGSGARACDSPEWIFRPEDRQAWPHEVSTSKREGGRARIVRIAETK